MFENALQSMLDVWFFFRVSYSGKRFYVRNKRKDKHAVIFSTNAACIN